VTAYRRGVVGRWRLTPTLMANGRLQSLGGPQFLREDPAHPKKERTAGKARYCLDGVEARLLNGDRDGCVSYVSRGNNARYCLPFLDARSDSAAYPRHVGL